MDCRTALEILDVARPDSGDLSDPEFAEAAAHMESHADCREEFLRRQQLDREIGAAVRDVAVPHDLQARLLAGLAEADDEAPPVAVAPTSETKTLQQRRSWIKLVAGAAACLVAGVIAWQSLPSGSDPIDVELLPGQVVESLSNGSLSFAGLPAFSENYEPEIPLTWQSESSRVSFSKPKAFQLPDRPDQSIAIYELTFRDRSGPVTGYLLVLPTDMVTNRPGELTLKTVATKYHRRLTASRSWSDGELVYVCVVPSGHFKELERLLTPQIG